MTASHAQRVRDGPSWARALPSPWADRLVEQDAWARRGFGGHWVGALLRVEQALVVLARELGVDRQPQRLAIVALARQRDRELDALATARHRGHVGGVLLGREHLLQQAGQLHLAEHAAGLHVGQHALEVAHALRQSLHLAQAAVHLLQLLGDEAEAFAEPGLQRRLELLFDRGTHLFEARLVALLQSLQAEYGERLILHFAPDKGQSDAVNRGMSMARGTVLGWLNSDDRLRPDSLRVATGLDTAEPRWLYGRGGIIDERGRQISRPIVWYKNWRGRTFSLCKLITEDFIPQMATFWNRALWDRAGGLDPNRHLDMDYDLFLRFALICTPEISTEYLGDFRVHRNTKSSQQTEEHLIAARQTARFYAAKLGFRGNIAYLLHRIYSERTRLIYRLVKP